ncbi:MAG: TIGR00730 family Rossman fold protein [Pseudomonadota bacterium]
MSETIHQSVCVFCGSRPGNDPVFSQSAQNLGTGLAQAGMRLVYGAGDVGLMGDVARAAQAAGGQTFGVIPEHLLAKEVGKRDLTQFVITQDMHERKKVMFMNADAIVALPGGPGTLDEVFEVLTWAQLGLHAKPVFLLNIAGYWSPLLDLIEATIAKGFADASFRGHFTALPDVSSVLRALKG